jgi:hypothetical protein
MERMTYYFGSYLSTKFDRKLGREVLLEVMVVNRNELSSNSGE